MENLRLKRLLRIFLFWATVVLNKNNVKIDVEKSDEQRMVLTVLTTDKLNNYPDLDHVLASTNVAQILIVFF